VILVVYASQTRAEVYVQLERLARRGWTLASVEDEGLHEAVLHLERRP
jgi:hypothetical protein